MPSYHATMPHLWVFSNSQKWSYPQRFKCHNCRRQFVEQPTKKVIAQATGELIDRLLLEGISLAGIARAVQVSEQWLQTYVNQKYAIVPRSVQVRQKKGRLTIQCDELWSFVADKRHKQWVWLALDSNTREIVGVYIGARDEAAARQLWNSLPPVYRQCAGCSHRFLGSLWSSATEKASSTCG